MLKPDIYRESVDGEALQWAINRSNHESSKRMAVSSNPIKQNIVLLSDGCPMDRATQQANDENYLIDHLKLVLKWGEHQANTSIWGCGVGQEMRGFFRRKLSWNKDDSIVQSILAWADEFKRQR
jgi:cobaltochelatase CobT